LNLQGFTKYKIPYWDPTGRNANLVFFRFFKTIYTAALRFGVAIDGHDRQEPLSIYFKGYDAQDIASEAKGRRAVHKESYKPMRGIINISGKEFPDTILVENRTNRNPYLVTFWPETLGVEAELNETEPLVRCAQDGEPIPIKTVIDKMHPVFLDNPSMSPATLMAKIYNKTVVGEHFEKLQSAMQELEKELLNTKDELKMTRLHAEKLTDDNKRKDGELESKDETIDEQTDTIDEQAYTIKDQAETIEKLNSQQRHHQLQVASALASENSQYSKGILVDIPKEAKLLKDVTKGVRIKKGDGTRVNCTFLWFYDTDAPRIMDGWADKTGEKFRKALSLKGKLIMTSTWQPEIYKSEKWFRDIWEYKLD
jgi:hypothetical protein